MQCERDPRHVVELVQHCGGRVVAEQSHAGGAVAHRVRLPSHAAKVQLLNELGHYDGDYFPDMMLLARRIVGARRGQSVQASAIQQWVQEYVGFIGEGIEAFPSAPQVVLDGCGDCDDHAILVLALCQALGIEARAHTYDHPPTHVAAQVRPAGCPWLWLETTIAGAELGEHPVEAAKRLRYIRPDITGENHGRV